MGLQFYFKTPYNFCHMFAILINNQKQLGGGVYEKTAHRIISINSLENTCWIMFKYLNEAQTIWMKFYWKMRLRRIHSCEYLFLKWQIQTNFSTNMHKKWSFPLRISSVSVAKFAGKWGFGQFTKEILNGKLYIFLQCKMTHVVSLVSLNLPENSRKLEVFSCF